MSVYTNPPEWEAQGKKPPSSKRTDGWKPGDRVPASWLNWFWFSTVNSLREIAQAFVTHRDASAPHDGHETKAGATAKVEAHSQKTTAVHGVGQQYVAKTSRSDQWPSWNDIPDKPSTFPADAATLPQASTSQQGIVQLTNSRSSTSETLAVTAKALNDHRTSADHDGRYYTKQEIDNRIGSGVVNIVPDDNILAESLQETQLWPHDARVFWRHKGFRVNTPGRFRITCEVYLAPSSTGDPVWGRVRIYAGGNQMSGGTLVGESASLTSQGWNSVTINTDHIGSSTSLWIEVLNVSENRRMYSSVRNARVRGRVQAVPISEAIYSR